MTQSILGAVTAIAIVLTIGVMRDRSTTPSLVAVADNGGEITAIAIHFDPGAAAEVSETYQDLLRELPAGVDVHVLVENAADFEHFQTLLADWNIAATERFRGVEVGKRITTWSRDRYTLIEQGDRRLLLVPPRPTLGNESRKNDWDAPFALAEATSGLDTLTADLVFEGGDLTATATHVFATALLRERNRGGDLYDVDALRAWLRRHTGKTPIILGDVLADVPGHHIGMFVTPLDDRRVLVGDADLGIALFDSSDSDPARLPLAIDRSEGTLQRFRNVADELRAHGFEVIAVPLVPLSDGLTYVTYNNALLEHREGALHAYLPQFGFAALDEAGRAAYAEAGVVVHDIRVRNVYRHNGTVRCLVNIVSREPG